MATRRKTLADDVPEQIQTDEITTGNVLPDEDGGEDDALAELRGLGAGGDHKYTVYRVSSEAGKKPGYCQTYTVGDLSLDSIRDSYGGGKYKIRVTDAQGRYKAQTTVDIVDAPKQSGGAAPAVAAGSDLSGIAEILAATRPMAASGGTDFSAVLVAMMDSQAKMFQAIMSRPVDKGPSITDILAMMNAGKDTNKTDPVALLLQGLELGKNLGGGETGLLDVAKDALGVLPSLIEHNKTNPRPAQLPHIGPTPPVQPIPNATGESTIQPLQETAQVKLIQQYNWVKAQLGHLVVQAARGKSPALYAEVMLDNLPPYISVEDIKARMGDENAVAQLAQIDERVAQHAAWFEEFCDEVQELLEPEDDTPADSINGNPLDAPMEGSEA